MKNRSKSFDTNSLVSINVIITFIIVIVIAILRPHHRCRHRHRRRHRRRDRRRRRHQSSFVSVDDKVHWTRWHLILFRLTKAYVRIRNSWLIWFLRLYMTKYLHIKERCTEVINSTFDRLNAKTKMTSLRVYLITISLFSYTLKDRFRKVDMPFHSTFHENIMFIQKKLSLR